MDRKTKQIYEDLFRYIKDNIFDMDPSIIVTDYEESMRQAIQIVFPKTQNVGCWFHFCQAVRRNMRSRKALVKYIRSSKEASAAYHKLMALPLLPPGLIKGAFSAIRSKIMLIDSQCVFAPFLNYFQRQWIQKIGGNSFSVYKQKTRTTSAVEAYNGVLGRLADKNGHFFKFVAIIRNEEFFKSCHFSMLSESGGSLCKRKKRQDADKSSKIEKAIRLLENGDISVTDFLSRMVYEPNKICVKLIPEENLFEEEEYSDCENSEDDNQEVTSSTLNDSDCVICVNKPSNIVMLPCRHMKICSECNLKLMAEHYQKL
ncbi:uncharacterized protein LOC142236118 [Haematobia irritans]|uniref:uncharacterized protein LOC142236118 n=1 Tax=Haematobia irritans TaxID=7368 RepID=UPI003F4F5ABF